MVALNAHGDSRRWLAGVNFFLADVRDGLGPFLGVFLVGHGWRADDIGYLMTAAGLAQVLEARGFESVWAPEHSHIPASRRSPWPGGGELPKQYYDVMDPFVTLTAAAMATKSLKVGTGVCLVNQRDPIQLAKLVASIDQVSGGRFLFGIGVGWNAEEMENHGTTFATRAKLVRERIEAMKEIWTKSKAEYHGEFVNFDPIMTWPKPVTKPHPPVIVGGAFPQAARRAVRMLGAGSDEVGQRLAPALATFARNLTAQADAKGDRLRAKRAGEAATGFSA